ncbi:hypothetical protein BH23BAC2_BH23BAC2_12580 [soil metagenome]
MKSKRKSMFSKNYALSWNKLFNNSVTIILILSFAVITAFVIWLELRLELISNLWNII